MEFAVSYQGGGNWGHPPWGAGLGAQQHIFCSHFKHVLRKNFDQSML